MFDVIPASGSRLAHCFALAVVMGADPYGGAPQQIGSRAASWLSGSRAGGTRQSGSPGRGPQAANQASCSARTARRSRHRSSGVTQCEWACVPLVIPSSAVASGRAAGETADPVYRIVHASRITSSISRSVMLPSSGMPLDAPAYPEPPRRNQPGSCEAGSTQSRRFLQTDETQVKAIICSWSNHSVQYTHSGWAPLNRGSVVELTTRSSPVGKDAISEFHGPSSPSASQSAFCEPP